MAVKFSTKLFIIFTLAFCAAVAVSTALSLRAVRHSFAQLESERIAAAVALTSHEVDRLGQDIDHRLGAVAESEATTRMAMDINSPKPDLSLYSSDARGAANQQLFEIFEFVTDDGTVISSFHFPDRIGQKDDWVIAAATQHPHGAFLAHVDTTQGPVIAQLAVRAVRVGEKKMYLAGGRRLDQRLLESLVLPAGVRALLYLNLDGKGIPQSLLDARGEQTSSGVVAPLVASAMLQPGNPTREPFPSASASETFYAMPLVAPDNSVPAVVIFAHTAIERLAMEKILFEQALLGIALGVAIGWLVSLWGAARISRPLAKLASSATAMAAGSSRAPATESGSREIVTMARALNETMEKLLAERARLTQAERVAAWREMARRAAHDFDVALMRLESATVLSETLRSTDIHGEGAWGEGARGEGARGEGTRGEGTRGEGAMLRESLESMRGVESRLREFGDLLVLPMQTVRLNEIVRTVVRDFEPLFSSPLTEVTRPPIHPEVALAEDLPDIHGDPTLLTRAVDLLLLFAVNSMPAGGSFTLRTFATAALVHLHISWLGSAPAPEESDRAFTPGGLDRRYSTGLELATVQSIISDHGGSLAVVSSDGYNHLRVQFPAVAASAESAQSSPESQPAS